MRSPLFFHGRIRVKKRFYLRKQFLLEDTKREKEKAERPKYEITPRWNFHSGCNLLAFILKHSDIPSMLSDQKAESQKNQRREKTDKAAQRFGQNGQKNFHSDMLTLFGAQSEAEKRKSHKADSHQLFGPAVDKTQGITCKDLFGADGENDKKENDHHGFFKIVV
jgi:hypothetical protein